MGFAKRMMEEYEQRGYGGSDKCVCEDCVGNEHLKQFIIDNNNNDVCDFCNGNNNFCVNIEDLCGEIMGAVNSEYEKAVESMGWDGKEGGYIGATTWDTYELFDDLNDDMLLEPDVLDEIENIVDHDIWCRINPYGLTISREHSYMWHGFSDMVKYKTRYVFFRMPERNQYDEEADFLILDHVGESVIDLDLITILPKGFTFYRGRQHNKNGGYTKLCDLCSPPPECAKPNRMSAEGISILYAASDEKTAYSEICTDEQATIALFESQRELVILDLASDEKFIVPNLFDANNRHLRETIRFLSEFRNDLIKPINEMPQIEYIPSQVIAEYFRYLHDYDGKTIDGISYKSSKGVGVCYALFLDHESCLTENILTLKQYWDTSNI